jgi:hypothetical protein
VLGRFSQRQCIYFTPLMLESAEELARLNIKTEINNNLRIQESEWLRDLLIIKQVFLVLG